MTINCIIVEDEPLARDRMTEYVMKVPYLKLLATFDSALAALGFLKSKKIDLVFLDINLGEFSGIQLLETSAVSSQVVLTTAYSEFALKGFDLKVTDYLLKPFTFERFVQAVDRVQQKLPRKKTQSLKPYIFVKIENRLEKLFIRDIVYIEGMGDYRRIHTTNKRIMTLQTFTEFEKVLPANLVCRVHKSFMVSIEKIDSIEKDRILIRNTVIPISETYKKSFFEIIGG